MSKELQFIRTQYNSEPTEGVKMDDTLITEQTGYRSTKEIVEGMILAGKRLEDYRHSRLDNFADEYEQDPIDVYEKDLVEEEEIISSRLRYRRQKWQESGEEQSGEETTELEGSSGKGTGPAVQREPTTPQDS